MVNKSQFVNHYTPTSIWLASPRRFLPRDYEVPSTQKGLSSAQKNPCLFVGKNWRYPVILYPTPVQPEWNVWMWLSIKFQSHLITIVTIVSWNLMYPKTHRIHGAGIYANIWGILMVNVTVPYMAAPWILWERNYHGTISVKQLDAWDYHGIIIVHLLTAAEWMKYQKVFIPLFIIHPNVPIVDLKIIRVPPIWHFIHY